MHCFAYNFSSSIELLGIELEHTVQRDTVMVTRGDNHYQGLAAQFIL